MVGRRFFPNVMRGAQRAYMRNPGAYNRGLANALNYGKGALKGAAFAGAGAGMHSAASSRKRRASTDAGAFVQPFKVRSIGTATPNIPNYAVRGGGRGMYAGKLPKGKKKNMAKQSLSKYAVRGSTTTRETVGSVNDSDSVYLYFHKFAPSDLIYNISKALIRKLCEMAFKVHYTSFDNLVLGGNYSPITGSYKIVVTYVNVVTGAATTAAILIQDLTTLTVLAGTAGLLPLLDAYSSGFGLVSGSNPIEPFTMTLYKTLTADTESILLASLNLNDEIVQMESTVEVKIQNRSISASGSSSTDVVDSNPLQGYIYEFGSIPKTRDVRNLAAGAGGIGADRASAFGSIKFENGLNLIRGSSLPSAYLEPISSKSFRNCKGVSKIRLEPGAIKNCYRKFKKSCNVVRFLQDFNLQKDSAVLADARIIKTLGGGVMISLEDMINVNSTAKITVTYEAEHRLGLRLRTRKGAVMVGDFTQSTYNNVVA